jgi:hypothetical protein
MMVLPWVRKRVDHGFWHAQFWGLFKGEKNNKFRQVEGGELKWESKPKFMNEHEYTVLKEYQNNSSELFNEPLRLGKAKRLPKRVHDLQKMILASPKISKPLLLFRGISVFNDTPEAYDTVKERNMVRLQNKLVVDRFVDQFQIGQVYEPSGFQSFSMDVDVAREFGNEDILVVGFLPKNSKAYHVQMGYGHGWNTKNEQEILLPLGTVWLYLGELVNASFAFIRPDREKLRILQTRKLDEDDGKGPVKLAGRRILVFALLEPDIPISLDQNLLYHPPSTINRHVKPTSQPTNRITKQKTSRNKKNKSA